LGFRFIHDFVFAAPGETQKRTRNQVTADSTETEKMAPRFQQCLHRAIIDTSIANRVTRKKADSLKNVEHTLADREQTEGGPGEKNRANERLITQRRKRPRLKVADFSDEFIERLPFRCNFPT
jgi:hypothetical protein